MKNNVDSILQKSIKTHNLYENEILYLLKSKDTKKICYFADIVRKKYLGDEVHLRALIEFSNYCKQNCLYCGLQRDNLKLVRYRIKEQDIISLAKQAKDYGYKTVVLQSGEDIYYTVKKMAYIISEIKKLDIAITLSVGEKTFNEYKAYKQAGADRYLLRIETTDETLYNKLNPQMSFKNRIQCLENIKKLGFEVGSGILVGLPGQTLKSIAKDIVYLQSIQVDMAGIGPFIYNPDTSILSFGKINHDNFDLSLKVMAILRLIMPEINIPATTAMEALNSNGRILALQSGANVVMPNATEVIYKKKYKIYPEKNSFNDSPIYCRLCIENKIKSIGRFISQNKGFHKQTYSNVILN